MDGLLKFCRICDTVVELGGEQDDTVVWLGGTLGDTVLWLIGTRDDIG